MADHISKLVLGKFAALTDGLKSQYAKRKMMAGIVMMKDEDLSTAKVICVTTGTKCISGENLSREGVTVNDFCAGILARRAMQRFLYSQLELMLSDDPEKAANSIFEKCEGESKYQVKEDYQFHMYMSIAPCGDSRIFAPHEPKPGATSKAGDKPANKIGHGQLRTKIGSGEGTIPVKSTTGIQTWDGVMQGEKLLTMSSSDKIARWNLLGIQGGYYYFSPLPDDNILDWSKLKHARSSEELPDILHVSFLNSDRHALFIFHIHWPKASKLLSWHCVRRASVSPSVRPSVNSSFKKLLRNYLLDFYEIS